ncbi:unnamed protein product [Rangifer tarandus platyrhynchus]|uniref:Uncharacterized protein n=1 Tax=Rangifer tarandus platyrhynchus TaxID=3082113 RepID=A0ABN8YHN9_RANTA|nr:unnamed protein product [Rangifer tarandus platyrhynchus]
MTSQHTEMATSARVGECTDSRAQDAHKSHSPCVRFGERHGSSPVGARNLGWMSRPPSPPRQLVLAQDIACRSRAWALLGVGDPGWTLSPTSLDHTDPKIAHLSSVCQPDPPIKLGPCLLKARGSPSHSVKDGSLTLRILTPGARPLLPR